MLNYIDIRHFAIIDQSAVELNAGMTALTGETGAGKSILLDALGQAIGNRGSADIIQQGAERAEVSASFDIDKLPLVAQWLVVNDLDDDGDCVLRRVQSRKGKARASINGRPVSVQLLRELGEQLVSIHGQNEHQQLAGAAAQRVLLDSFANSPVSAQVESAYDAWQSAEKRWRELTDQSQARQHRIDLLQFQLQEFDALDIGGLSIADIESEHRWLANADRLVQLSARVLDALDTEAGDALSLALHPLTELVGIDERLREALDLVESASIQSAEAATMLRNHASALEHDDKRLEWLDERLATLHRLAKKHQVSIEELDRVEATLREEFDSLTSPDIQDEQLEREVKALHNVYKDACSKQSRLRKRVAKKLSAAITDSMQSLAMEGGKMQIEVTTDASAAYRHGQDTVSFKVSPNPGVSAAPLAKVASGGELSRISLCIALATIDKQPVPTLIFDEVDAGVGGAVAETVGRLLREVAAHAQVLCVTHLPQVAAQAHHHLKVSKTASKGKTSTELQSLTGKQTTDEIARMLGGKKITSKSKQHAQEMLDSVASES